MKFHVSTSSSGCNARGASIGSTIVICSNFVVPKRNFGLIHDIFISLHKIHINSKYTCIVKEKNTKYYNKIK